MPDDPPEVDPPPLHGARSMQRSTLVATVILGMSVAIAFAFVVQRGGLLLPEASPLAGNRGVGGPTPVPGTNPGSGADVAGQASATRAAGAPAAVEPTAVVAGATSSPSSINPGFSSFGPVPPTAQPTLVALTQPPSELPTPSPVSSPANPTAKPAESSSPRASEAPAATVSSGTATPSRLRLLTPCPGRADCYVYVVRTGDALYSIARFFGVDLRRVRALNTWIGADQVIRPGQHVMIPTPTR